MKKRGLFVFAGQSNMMGAAVLAPKTEICVKDSYEYKHKPIRFGAASGEFIKAEYSAGEFSYTDEAMKTAYDSENTDSQGLSKVAEYGKNTYFCPSMSNLKDFEKCETYPFSHYSESTFNKGATLAPLFSMAWEKLGEKCAYAHIAKGGVSINYYFNREMMEEYNSFARKANTDFGEDYPLFESQKKNEEASRYFDEKTRDFFRDASERFGEEDTSLRPFVWCQGESDRKYGRESYKKRLEILWKHMRELGFTHFFCVRVGFWGNGEDTLICDIMRAQEEFCNENENCYIVTRAMSMMPNPVFSEEECYVETPEEKYQNCRDCYYGFKNEHINEKGFLVIAEKMAENLHRIIVEGKEPFLEKENVRALAVK